MLTTSPDVRLSALPANVCSLGLDHSKWLRNITDLIVHTDKMQIKRFFSRPEADPSQGRGAVSNNALLLITERGKDRTKRKSFDVTSDSRIYSTVAAHISF